jgi:hypothetical protein
MADGVKLSHSASADKVKNAVALLMQPWLVSSS